MKHDVIGSLSVGAFFGMDGVHTYGYYDRGSYGVLAFLDNPARPFAFLLASGIYIYL